MLCIHLIHETCPEGVNPTPQTLSKHLLHAQTVHGRHCWGERGHKGHSWSLQPTVQMYNSAVECWFITVRELQSMEANVDREKKRV